MFRDIVKAYSLLANAPTLEHSVYNIASGKAYSGFDILSDLKSAMGLEIIEPVVDQSRVRPTDAAEIIGDATRISEELGWQPHSSVANAIPRFRQTKKELIFLQKFRQRQC